MSAQSEICSACGHAYLLPADATDMACPHCGHRTTFETVGVDNDDITPDPEGAAIGRIPLRRKPVSRENMVQSLRGDVAEPSSIQPKVGCSDEARRALERDGSLAEYGRPVIHDLSAPGLDPPPLPDDSGPMLAIPEIEDEPQREPSPRPRRPEPRKPEAQRPEPRKPEAQRPEPRKPEAQRPEPRRPEAQRPEPRKPEPRRPEPRKPEAQRPEPHEREQVIVAATSRKDAEGTAKHFNAGKRRQSRPTVAVPPNKRLHVHQQTRPKRPTRGHGNARARPKSRGNAMAAALFLIGLLAALSAYLLLTR